MGVQKSAGLTPWPPARHRRNALHRGRRNVVLHHFATRHHCRFVPCNGSDSVARMPPPPLLSHATEPPINSA